MIDRIKGLLTRKKLFRFFKIAVIVVLTTIALLSLLGTVAHASGLVDDTVNADNLYSQYPLENYQLDFYVDNSWGWLPWNWLDGIGKSVQYGLYCITNFIWTISLYLSNATTIIRKAIRATSSMAPIGTTAPSLYISGPKVLLAQEILHGILRADQIAVQGLNPNTRFLTFWVSYG